MCLHENIFFLGQLLLLSSLVIVIVFLKKHVFLKPEMPNVLKKVNSKYFYTILSTQEDVISTQRKRQRLMDDSDNEIEPVSRKDSQTTDLRE